MNGDLVVRSYKVRYLKITTKIDGNQLSLEIPNSHNHNQPISSQKLFNIQLYHLMFFRDSLD
jgi:hypothetical protein